LQSELGATLGSNFGGTLGGERRALAAALKADRSGRGVTQRVAVRIGDSDDRVVKRRLHVGDAPAHVPPSLAFLALGHAIKLPVPTAPHHVQRLHKLPAHFLDALLARDGLARSLARAGVGARPLAAHRQAAAMAKAAIALDILEPGDVLLHLAAQGPFDRVFLVEDAVQPVDVVVAQVLGLAVRIDPGLLAQPQGQRRPDAVEVAQRNVRRLFVGGIDTLNTGHGPKLLLALALLVTWIGANHVQPTASPDQLAILANALDARSHFHRVARPASRGLGLGIG